MDLEDAVPGRRPSGELIVHVWRRGVRVETWRGKNLIVDTYRAVHAHLLGGDSGYPITKIGFGTNGTTPVAGNTGLTGAYTKAIGSVSYPATGKLAIAFTLGSDEANGMSIFEFGLLTTGGTLYARRVRTAALAKTSAISLTGTWTLTL